MKSNYQYILLIKIFLNTINVICIDIIISYVIIIYQLIFTDNLLSDL